MESPLNTFFPFNFKKDFFWKKGKNPFKKKKVKK